MLQICCDTSRSQHITTCKFKIIFVEVRIKFLLKFYKKFSVEPLLVHAGHEQIFQLWFRLTYYIVLIIVCVKGDFCNQRLQYRTPFAINNIGLSQFVSNSHCVTILACLCAGILVVFISFLSNSKLGCNLSESHLIFTLDCSLTFKIFAYDHFIIWLQSRLYQFSQCI